MLAWDFWELEMRFSIFIWAFSQFAELSIFSEAILVMHARYRFCPWLCRLDAGDLIHVIRGDEWKCEFSFWSGLKEEKKKDFRLFSKPWSNWTKGHGSNNKCNRLAIFWVACWKPSASGGAIDGVTCYFFLISSRIKVLEMTNRTNKLHNVKFKETYESKLINFGLQ